MPTSPVGGIIVPDQTLRDMLALGACEGLAFKVIDFDRIELEAYAVSKIPGTRDMKKKKLSIWPVKNSPDPSDDTIGVRCDDHSIQGTMDEFEFEFKDNKASFEFCFFSRSSLQQMLDASDGRELIITGCHLNFGILPKGNFTDFGLKIGYREANQDEIIGYPNFFIGCTCPPGWGDPRELNDTFFWDKLMKAWNEL